MKKMKKILALLLCAILLICASVAATVAYLTDTKTVTNTFSVGKVAITLDEADVDEYGRYLYVTGQDSNGNDILGVEPKDSEGNNYEKAERVTSNQYKLIPGKGYIKDPTIHVDASSESCYLFVEIDTNVSSYIDMASIKDQIESNGWDEIISGVWSMKYTKGQAIRDFQVFSNFTVPATANSIQNWDSVDAASHNLDVVAYAVQDEGFTSALDAWNKTFGA